MPLIVRDEGRHIVVITIDNQTKRNAMSRADLGELAALWGKLEASPCRAIVITGAGDKGFCAGADIGGDLTADEETSRVVNRALLKTDAFPKPIIAAVNGDCAGGGVELLLSTDIRISAPHARFGLPEVKWSIYPFGGATVKLVNQIGYVHAMDLLLTGRLIDAATAARLGLINEVVTSGTALDAAIAKAHLVAENSPSAVQAVKYQISHGIATHTQSREALEQQLGDRVRAGPHFAEGVAAFKEKRKPKYE
ncbi:MAG: enoyl-CoA hydratase/isomerase family protein [Hyphomicrobiaceae bacterium]